MVETQAVQSSPGIPPVQTYDPAPLHTAMNIIAGRCNYARNLDGSGFSKFDADFGHKLAETPVAGWSPKMTAAAYRLAHKYRRQLAEAGHPYENLVAPPDPMAGNPAERFGQKRQVVGYDGQSYIVEFPYNPTLVDAVKRIPGARFTRVPKACWTIPPTPQSRAMLKLFVEQRAFEVDAAAEPSLLSAPVATKVEDLRRCDCHPKDPDSLAITFPYDTAIAAEVRAFGTWEGKDQFWRAPIIRRETVDQLRLFLSAWSFTLTPEAQARIEAVLAMREQTLAESRAEAAEPMEIEGLARQPFPFQWAGIRYGVAKKRLFIADEMGLGKTTQGIVTVLAADAFPAVVVCPATLKENWRREWKLTAPHVKVEVVEGMTPKSWTKGLFNTAPDVVVINYDILGPWVPALRELDIASMITDEAHYIKNGKTQRGQAVEDLAAGLEWIIMLTGTPILNRPAELIFPLKVMGRLQDLGGSRYFTTRYCGGYGQWGSGQGADNLGELNDTLRACCYIRRMKKDVLKELPAKTRTALPLPIDNVAEYRKTEADFIHWVRDRASRHEKFLKQLEAQCMAMRDRLRAAGSLDEEIHDEVAEFRRQAVREWQDSAEERALRAEVLVRMGVLEQCAVKGKMKAAIAWVEDFLESGEKLILFTRHKDPLKQLAAKFNAPTISGDDDMAARQAAVDKFQKDPSCKLIICNLQAGGVGITLTAASNVAFLELGWTPAEHDQAEDRAHRIGQTDNVTAWYLLGEGTIDQYKAAKLDDKRAIVDAATEGGNAPAVSVFGDVLQMLAGVNLSPETADKNDAQMGEAMSTRG